MDATRIVDSLDVKRKRTGRVNGEVRGGKRKRGRARAEVRRTGRPGEGWGGGGDEGRTG